MHKANLDGTIVDYSRAIGLNPKNSAPYFSRAGRQIRHKGDLDGAIARLLESDRTQPKDATAYFSQGGAKQKKRDLDGAIDDYSKAIGF